jgi:copper chaperone CopZ
MHFFNANFGLSTLSLMVIIGLISFLPSCTKKDASINSTVEIVYSVPEMHCDGCVRSISTALNQLPGVDSVNVSLESYTAFIKVDTLSSSPFAIQQTIEGLGYSAKKSDN